MIVIALSPQSGCGQKYAGISGQSPRPEIPIHLRVFCRNPRDSRRESAADLGGGKPGGGRGLSHPAFSAHWESFLASAKYWSGIFSGASPFAKRYLNGQTFRVRAAPRFSRLFLLCGCFWLPKEGTHPTGVLSKFCGGSLNLWKKVLFEGSLPAQSMKPYLTIPSTEAFLAARSKYGLVVAFSFMHCSTQGSPPKKTCAHEP